MGNVLEGRNRVGDYESGVAAVKGRDQTRLEQYNLRLGVKQQGAPCLLLA